MVTRSTPPFGADTIATDRRRRLLMGIGVLIAIMLVDCAFRFLAAPDRMRPAPYAILWGVEIPITFAALAVWYGFAKRRRWGPLRTLATTAVLAGLIGVLFGLAVSVAALRYPMLRHHPERAPRIGRAIAFGFLFGQLHAGLWVMAFVYPFAAEDARIRALEADRLRAAVEAAQLRAHLEPHFLLNTLNAIAGLVTEDPREARRLLGCLGDLLRDAARPGDEMQTVDEEVGWLERYADILETRHSGALRFRWEIAEDARMALVPRLLLQPLVENAVKHGALKRAADGEVVVRVALAASHDGASRVVCTIEDNGPGLGELRSGAIGLHVVRRRLELNHPGALLRLESSERGTRSILELPVEAGAPC